MKSLLLAMGLFMSLSAAFADCALVKDNVFTAQITTADTADIHEKAAAKTLQEIFEFAAQTLGHKAKIGKSENAINIQLAQNKNSPTFKDALKNNFKKQPTYRFVVCDNEIKILYPETKNATNAVGFFLQKIGFRFFGPTPSEWVIPQLKNIKNFDIEFTPEFGSIQIYTENPTPEFKLFLELNGNNPSFGGFGHSLQDIFPKKLLKTNPQFRATIAACNPENLRFENPNFLSDTVAYHAANYAEKYFLENPDKWYFSLSICDDANFDESLYPQSAEKYFFRNAPNKSGEVFYFTNKAAKIISQKNPDKYLGCLAYLICEKPPSFELEKNLIPVFTTDRENYFNENYKLEDFAAITEWGKKCKNTFGIYDYGFGKGYAVPHNIESYIFEGIEQAYKSGAKIYFGEYTPFFEYDNFKIYAVLQKLNCADANLNEIKKEFFEFKYGKAAPFVVEFFDTAQNVWATQKRQPRWLGTYLKESSLSLFGAGTLQKMQLCMENALNTPNSPKAFLNVYELSKAFEFTKASIEKFRLQQKLCNIKIKDKAAAKEALKLLELCEEAQQRVLTANQSISSNGKICKGVTQITWPIAISYLAFAQKLKEFLPESEIKTKSKKLNDALKIAPIKKPLFYYAFKNKNANNAAFSPMPKEFLASYKVYKDMRFNVGKCLQIAAAESVCISRYENAQPNKSYLFKISAMAKMQVGSQWSLFCLFLDKNNKILKRSYVSLPSPCKFKDFAEFEIAETAPKGATKVGFQLSAAYMKTGDEILVKDFSVFVSQ